MMNAFDILDDYTQTDFNIPYGELLYNEIGVILLEEGENYEQYDKDKVYNKDDMVYVRNIRVYNVYKSLLDKNTEPLNSNTAWEKVIFKVITQKQFEADRLMLKKILPYSLHDITLPDDEEEYEANKAFLSRLIGLFLGCYYYNNYNADKMDSYGRIATNLHIGIQSASYIVPDWTLKQENLFYNNPFGRQILALKDKIFTSKFALVGKIDIQSWKAELLRGRVL